MTKRQMSLVGHITSSEVVQRRWIATIVGDWAGPSPAEIKQDVFNVIMGLAPKIPGARDVTVGLGKAKHRTHVPNRDRLATRKQAKRVGNPNFGTYRKLDPSKKLTEDQAHSMFLASNGQLTREERIVLSHLTGWGAKKMSRRAISREFSLGGEGRIREIARDAWKKIGVTRIKNAFEKL